MKQNTETVAKIGFDKGNMTLKKTLIVLAPSILAASSNSFGIEEKNCINKKILNIDMDAGRIIAKIEKFCFNPNNDRQIEYRGIIDVSTGTIIKNMMMKLKNFLPGKRNLDIA